MEPICMLCGSEVTECADNEYYCESCLDYVMIEDCE